MIARKPIGICARQQVCRKCPRPRWQITGRNSGLPRRDTSFRTDDLVAAMKIACVVLPCMSAVIRKVFFVSVMNVDARRRIFTSVRKSRASSCANGVVGLNRRIPVQEPYRSLRRYRRKRPAARRAVWLNPRPESATRQRQSSLRRRCQTHRFQLQAPCRSLLMSRPPVPPGEAQRVRPCVPPPGSLVRHAG